MTRSALLLLLATLTTALGATPRWYAPPVLRPGSVNEVYGWDTVSVPNFTVEVVREGAPIASARGFAVDAPLPGLEKGPPLRWSAALVGLEPLVAPGPVTVRILGAGGVVLAHSVSEVAAREFSVESIPLDRAMSQLREQPHPRKDREARDIWAVYLGFEPRSPWPGGRFALPVSSAYRLSARYGDTRHYLYSDGTDASDYHRGTDFAVPVGTPVFAPAPGKVVHVADRMLTGKTVVLEHAPGVFSVYFHLSRALWKVGHRLAAGERFALSGATGLVTGPHLHWEVRVGGVPVDPFDLVSQGLLDRQAVGKVVSSIERPTQ